VDAELAEAANFAIFLGRPLLVSGEAGTGKTELAHAIAAKLELKPPLEFPCKSDSVGRDLVYHVDHMRRLHDAYAAVRPVAGN
jgi:MoxR-like ATPase